MQVSVYLVELGVDEKDRMSLLQSLPYVEYEAATKFSCETCEELASIARLKTSYQHHQKPGEQLMRDLDRIGFTVSRYHRLLQVYNGQAPTRVLDSEGFKPRSKVAILIANELYQQNKLSTPGKDCMSLGEKLKSLGFIVVVLKDARADEMRGLIADIVRVIPQESYCLIYFAGHGFELCGVRYALGIDTPSEDIRIHHGVSANYILSQVEKCRPELCVLLMDMCAYSLDRELNPELFREVPDVEKYNLDGNLLIGFSTSSEEAAYEQADLPFSSSETVPSQMELDTSLHVLAKPTASIYGASLCKHIRKRLHIGDILDRVGHDLQNATKVQTPIKIQVGARKRFLYDRVSGDYRKVMRKLRQTLASSDFDNYTIFDLV